MDSNLPDTALFAHEFHRESTRHRVGFCLARRDVGRLEAVRGDFLSTCEEAELRQYESLTRRQSYLIGRYCAKEAVALLAPQKSRKAIDIRRGVFGQPVVSAAGTHGIQVSLSHSHGWGCAMAFEETHPMGIDLERIRPDQQSAIESQLTPQELRFATSSPVPQIVAVALMWSIKEALSKALRTGLMTPFRLFEVSSPSWDVGGLSCDFSSFGQYRAVGFLISDFALAIALPRRSSFGCELQEFRSKWLADSSD